MYSKLVVEKLHSFVGHQDCLYDLSFNPTDDFFFSASGDGMVVKWPIQNPTSGTLIAKVPNSIYSLHRLANSPFILAGQNYEGIHLLDWNNKKEAKSLKFSKASIFDIESVGDVVFIALGDGSVRVVDILGWKVITSINQSQKSARAIAINRLTNELAIGYSDYHIRVFDLTTWKKKYEWPAHLNSVFTLAYSTDSTTLFSGARDAKIKAWNVTTGYAPKQEVAAHLYAINSLAVSPNGKHLASGSMDKSVKIWETETLHLLKVVDKARYAGHGTSVNKVVWINDNRLLSAGDDRVINYWGIRAH